MSDSIEILEAALELANERYRECDRKCGDIAEMLGNRDRTIKDYRNLLIDVCSKLGLSDFVALRNWVEADNAIASGYLDHDLNVISQLVAAKQVIEDRDRQIAELKSSIPDSFYDQGLLIDNKELGSQLEDRDHKIEILEDNLNRARSEHLEQLRSVIQMLQPLATHEDKGILYLSHFGKAAMVYLIQKVVYANIEKLDPDLKSAYDDLL